MSSLSSLKPLDIISRYQLNELNQKLDALDSCKSKNKTIKKLKSQNIELQRQIYRLNKVIDRLHEKDSK